MDCSLGATPSLVPRCTTATCLVIFAHDLERNQDVCLKFMHTEDQWQREIQMRVFGEFIIPD